MIQASDHVIAFGLIWLGIGLYTLEGFRQATNAVPSAPDPPASALSANLAGR